MKVEIIKESEELNESISDTPIEDIEAFITEVKDRFPGSKAIYDGDTNTIKITLSESRYINEDTNEKVRMPRIIFKEFTDWIDDKKDMSEEITQFLKSLDNNPEKVLNKVKKPSKSSLETLIEQDPTILTKIIKKYQKFTQDFLNNYHFDKKYAINKYLSEIKGMPYRFERILNPRDLCKFDKLLKLLEIALKKYEEQEGLDVTYDVICNLWDSGYFDEESPIILKEYEYVSAKDIGKSETSNVYGGNFSSYEYYKVVFDISGKEIEFLDTNSYNWSGGWN